MDWKVLGIERRRRWSKDEKARIVEENAGAGGGGERGRAAARRGAEPALHLATAGAHDGAESYAGKSVTA